MGAHVVAPSTQQYHPHVRCACKMQVGEQIKLMQSTVKVHGVTDESVILPMRPSQDNMAVPFYPQTPKSRPMLRGCLHSTLYTPVCSCSSAQVPILTHNKAQAHPWLSDKCIQGQRRGIQAQTTGHDRLRAVNSSVGAKINNCPGK